MSPRSHTPLIYRVIPVWFVRVEDATAKLVANNQATRWVPASVGENRFQNWLSNARDWNVSRNRYWGTPMPIWTSDDGEEVSPYALFLVETVIDGRGTGRLYWIH